jgi:hypothetical protein
MRYTLSSGVSLRLALGGLWLMALAISTDTISGAGGVFLWTVPAGLTWTVLVLNAAAHPPRKPHGGVWFFLSLFGPFSLLLLLLRRTSAPDVQTSLALQSMEVDVDTDDLLVRLNSVEYRMKALQDEVAEIRAALQEHGGAVPAPSQPLRTTPPPATAREPFPSRPAAPAPTPTPQAPSRAAAPSVGPRAPFPSRPAQPETAAAYGAAPPKPPRDWDLAGPQVFAWAGGIVTLLGVIFFFILAAGHGWIGPGARVACGAAASAIVFGAGLWLRRRFEETDASLAAVGAGIAGGYATLAAATALYDMVPNALALVVAAGIAAAAVAVAVAWRAELIAALGLVGAIAAPALLATQGGLTAAGTGFAAIMTVAAAAVGVRMRWQWLLIGAAIASAPQIVALVVDAGRLDGGAIVLSVVFALIYLGTGIADQIARRDDALAPLPTMFILASIGITWLAAAQLFGPAGGTSAGIALLVAAAAFGTIAVALWLRAQRELGTLLGTIALAAAAVGVANVLSGPSLAYTFAAEGIVLAFAARQVREARLQLAALVYFVLAAGHALVFDAPPDTLFDVARHPASGAGALAATTLAALLVLYTSRDDWNETNERGVLNFLTPVLTWLREHQRDLRVVTACLAALFAIDAVSLVVVELFEDLWGSGGITASFHRGHVAVTALWSIAGLVAGVVATRRGATTARLIAFAWLGVTALKVAAYDGTQLVGLGFSLSFVVVASALLVAGYLRELLDETRTTPAVETFIAVGAAIAFAIVSLHPLDTQRQAGFGLLAIALVLGAFAASVFTRTRLRDLCTLLWAPALALAAVAAGLLLGDVWLTLAWASGAAALAVLAVYAHEHRFFVGSLGYLVLTAGSAFVHAPPSHLVLARSHPAHGLVGLLLLTAAIVTFAWGVRRLDEEWWQIALWVSGGLLVYAASLGILELFVRVSTASLHTDFQRGHTGVSALWGGLGLVLLYIGLTRGRRALRLGGFALLGVSLVKLFLYDLSQLSSVTRALSFLAVGAVLLLAGFFMQKLSAQLGDRDGPTAYS